ncbi:hypothetical protein ACQUWM_04940 [Marinobacter sp. DUT-3]|uniref:hypothetical protein n=1 Tax=Marinobacter sp. DUT-3 TaxID=3412036 RepID=UPI003D168CE2
MASKPFSSSRRAVLSHIGTAAVGGASVMLPPATQAATATSAEKIPEDLLLRLGEVGNFAAVQLIDIATDIELDFTKVEQNIRSQMSDVLPQAEKYNLQLLWQHEQILLAKRMQQFDVSTTKYVADAMRDPREIEIETSKTCGEVLVLILLETFGIGHGVRKQVTDALEKRGLYTLANEIGQAAKLKDWVRATMLLRKFFISLSNEKTLELLEKAIGEDAFRKVLKSMASRFVPWLGWGLMAASFATSLNANWDRLQECEW